MAEEGSHVDVQLMLEALKVGVPIATIEKVKAANVPNNILFDIGDSRSAKKVTEQHCKKYASVILAIATRFTDALTPNA
jgi:hypothetical protein